MRATVATELEPDQRDLDEVVYELFAELRDDSELSTTAPMPQLFRKAAVVLDGLDELEIDPLEKRRVYTICAVHAWSRSDSLRMHFFLGKALEYTLAALAVGDISEAAFDRMTEITQRVCEGDAAPINDATIWSHSTYEAFDMDQELLEDLMFMMNHDGNDTEYHCLHVVNGKVEEIPASVNRKRVRAMMVQRRQQQQREQQKKLQDGQEPSIDDILREIEAKEAAGAKKASKKQKKKQKKEAEKPEKGVAVLPGPAAFRLADDKPFVCPFGAADGISKQVWLQNKATKEALRLEPRDVGHLLAAKDGMSTNQEGFVLSARRDSVSGRIQGQKEFVELAGRLGRKARTHSFGNDGSKKDLLKEAEV